MAEGQKQRPSLTSHQTCARSGYSHLPQQPWSGAPSLLPDQAVVLSSQQLRKPEVLCSTSAQICTLSTALTPRRHLLRAQHPPEGTWEVMSEQKLNDKASGYILFLQTVAYFCMPVAGIAEKQERRQQASTWPDCKMREKFRGQECLKSCDQKGCVLLFASTWAEGGRIVVNSN